MDRPLDGRKTTKTIKTGKRGKSHQKKYFIKKIDTKHTVLTCIIFQKFTSWKIQTIPLNINLNQTCAKRPPSGMSWIRGNCKN